MLVDYGSDEEIVDQFHDEQSPVSFSFSKIPDDEDGLGIPN